MENLKEYSSVLKEVIGASTKIAKANISPSIEPEHLFLALLENESSNAFILLKNLNTPINELKKYFETQLKKGLEANNKDPLFSKDTKTILNLAFLTSLIQNSDKIGSEHILASYILDNTSKYFIKLTTIGITLPLLYYMILETEMAEYYQDEEPYQMIYINDKKTVLDSLKEIKTSLEKEHKVYLSNKTLEICSILSWKFLTTNDPLQNAILVLIRACISTHTNNLERPENILELEREIKDLKERKSEAICKNSFIDAVSFRKQEVELTHKLNLTTERWKTSLKKVKCRVNVEDILQAIAELGDHDLEQLRNRAFVYL